MVLLGIRFCSVTEQADELKDFFEKGLGLENRFKNEEEFSGGVFGTSSEHSWLEIWQQTDDMPAGIMLQLVVDDAEKMAEEAKNNGLQPYGPVEAHGEKIYYLQAPNGLNLSFQSKLESTH
ncbi:VOC family protein [Aliikangiella sp. IMCC44359]|uniref:VOC family protein n=1 Tax=Aliikangiella sp. IMCC44359 TaxID=3459125 RepID=UPI00403AEB43